VFSLVDHCGKIIAHFNSETEAEKYKDWLLQRGLGVFDVSRALFYDNDEFNGKIVETHTGSKL
jgi:hypothetical protein